MRKIVALHGFLGLKTDWDCLEIPCMQAVDLYQFQWEGLWQCARQLNNQFQYEKEKPILMGYSLGGRLALHALIEWPDLWHAGVIISAHPGLISKGEKEERVHSDRQWAKRFLEEEWDNVIRAWDNRPVLASSSFTFKRGEKNYDKKILAQILMAGSLGRQENLRGFIANLSLPLLWVVGENDSNYVQLSQSIALNSPQSKIECLPQAGHRLPWEQPRLFKNLILDLFRNK